MPRDLKGMLATLIVPVICVLLFNQVISTDINELRVEIVLENNSQENAERLQPLTGNPLFYITGTTSSLDEATAMMRRNEIHAIVVLGDRGKTQIITDNSNTIIGAAADAYLRSALLPQQSDNISIRMLYNPGLISMYQFGVGVFALFLIMQCVMFSASSMVKEKERHTIDTIIMSPVSVWKLMVCKLVAGLILNCIIGAIILAVTHYVIGLPVRGSLLVLALITVLFIIATMLLATYVSLSSSTEANALSTVITLVCIPILNFSGVIFPVECLPDWANWVSKFVYASWYVDAARKLLLQGTDYVYILKDAGILLVNTALFFSLCLYKIKDNRWLR